MEKLEVLLTIIKCPAPSVEATEEDSLVDPIDPVVDVPARCEVEVDERVALGVLLGQGLGPEPGLAGQVRARVLGEGLDCQRVLETTNDGGHIVMSDVPGRRSPV